MSDFSIILNHPDSEEIISKLLSGSSSKEIYQWIKLKYPGKDQSHLRLTQKILKEFSNSPYTDMYSQVKKDVHLAKGNKQISASLANNKVYNERIQEIAGQEIDMWNMVSNLVAICYQRVEQVFDTIQENPRNFKGDNYLLRYLAEITAAAEKLEKMRLESSGAIINHNVTMQAVEDYVALFQDIIRDILAEIDAETSMLVMERFHNKLNQMKPPTMQTQEERLKDVQVLEAKIVNSDL